MTKTLQDLDALSNSELEALLLDGSTPSDEELSGYEFMGANSPGWAKIAGIKKFAKGFYKKDQGLHGYNVAVSQNSLSEPWLPKPSKKPFGFYKVSPVNASSKDNLYLHALLLDYSRGKNPRFDPSRGLRDYLVRVKEDLYLGKAYYALGSTRIFASYFFLARWRQQEELELK